MNVGTSGIPNSSIRASNIILSTGRTGTMFFASLLRELYPQADVYHEAGERSRLINIFTNAHLSGFLPKQVPLWAWRRAVMPNLEKSEKEIYIDSNNQLYALLPLIPNLYPGLKVIHLVRDPREYVRSHLNWARHRPKSFIANYLTPFWQPNAWLLKEMPWSKWIRLSQFERYCWIWDYKNRYIGKMEKSSTPYLRIYFEDFFSIPDPLHALQRMLEFLNLEMVAGIADKFQRPVNPAQGRSFPKWSKWSTRQCQQLDAFCGAIMRKYGYGNETAWLKKLNVPGEVVS